MTEAQIQLQNALTTTFLANLAFLSEYDNELYHRLDELSRMIETGRYKEKYALEFLMESGDFDIYDIMNDNYLYGKQPKRKNDEFVRKVEFDEKNAILNLEEMFSYKTKFDINPENRFDFEMQETSAYSSNQMQEYKIVTKDYLEKRKKKLKEIKKFIFLGTLLGRHIPRIAKKIDAEIYLVLEKNLEIFRLSLFTVDYTILAGKGVVFSIMDETYKEEEKINLFLNINLYDNYLLKFSTTGINIDNYISIILGIMSSNKPSLYDYNRKLYIHLNRTIQRINEKYNFPQFKDIKDNLNYFKDIPILYIASGPSLDENIEWIKENQNNFFIVCIGSPLKKLLNNNIRIDIISTVDEQELLSTLQFDDETIKKIPEHTLLFASTMTHKKVLNKFSKNKIFLFEVFANIFINNFPFDGYSVGEITLDILLKLNVKEIYIVGLDLALNQETGETHSKDSGSGTKIYEIDKIEDRNNFMINRSTLKVKGNFKDKVITTALFYSSINFLEQQILIYKQNDVKIYNLSQNGAYFISTIPINVNDLNIRNLKGIDKIYIQFEEILKSYSKNQLDSVANKNIKSDIKYLENFISSQLNRIGNKNFKNFEDFSKNCLEEVLNELNSMKYRHLVIVLKKYYLFTVPYFKYCFNERNIKNEEKKINKIKEIFISQLKSILEDYLKLFKKLKEED